MNEQVNKDQNLSGDERLILHSFREEQAAMVLSWFRDERTFRYCGTDQFDHYPVLPDEFLKALGSADTGYFPLIAYDERDPVGHILLRYADSASKTIRFGFVVLDPKRRGKGYGSAMLRQAIRYARDTLQAQRITIGVVETNQPARKCYAGLGFRPSEVPIGKCFDAFGEHWRVLELEMGREIMDTY